MILKHPDKSLSIYIENIHLNFKETGRKVKNIQVLLESINFERNEKDRSLRKEQIHAMKLGKPELITLG